jgi:nitroimidazol reductase NimA-like FMN-containing flavoprotein (pyridoxamine 5'-phosphate oxidase superfamily)
MPLPERPSGAPARQPTEKADPMSETYQTERTTVKRIPQRGHYDRDTVHQVLDAGMVAHVGFVADGRPFVIPMVYVRVGEAVCLHGSPASRMLQALARGAEVCLTVTLVDGLVLARSAFHHSVNYRSVVVFGTAEVVEDPVRKVEVLRALTEHLVPGRWQDVRGPSESELRRTLVLAIPIREASAKIRTGPPKDDEPDLALPVWAGEVPLRLTSGEPVAAPGLLPDAVLPPYAVNYGGPVPVETGPLFGRREE